MAAVIEDAGGSDLEGRRQGKQVLAPREQRWGAAGGRGRLFTYEGDVIVFLEPGGASREQVLSLPRGREGTEAPAQMGGATLLRVGKGGQDGRRCWKV